MACGCEGYRQWRDRKAREYTTSQPVKGEGKYQVKTNSPREEDSTEEVVNPEVRALASRPAGSVGPAIMMVNRDYLTADEVLRRANPELKELAQTFSRAEFQNRAEDLLGNTILDMIKEQMLYQEVGARISEDQEPAVTKAVDKEVNALANQQAGGSMVRLEKLLKEQGSTMEDLRKQLRKQIVTQQYLREKMHPKIIVTREEMWEYYQNHLADFTEPASVYLFLIELNSEKYLPNGGGWLQATESARRIAAEKVRYQIRMIQNEILAGEDFSNIAKKYSTGAAGRVGGDIGWVSRGSYRLKRLEDEAFKLKAGQVSDPIQIDARTYILKVTESKPERKYSFSQAQERVKEKLEQEIYRKLVTEHLVELWKKSQISPIEPFLQATLFRMPSYESLKKR